MQEIIVKIRILEEHYANAHYLEAYEALHQLCGNDVQCGDFSSATAAFCPASTISITTSFSEG